MSIETTCDGCGGRFAATPDLSGQQVNCPSCGKMIVVPTTGIVVACQCGQYFEADVSLAGQTVSCSACSRTLAVPFSAGSQITSSGLDDVLSNAAAWSAPTPGGSSPLFGSSWQPPSKPKADDNRLLLFVGVIGSITLTLFITAVVLWKVYGEKDEPGDTSAQRSATTDSPNLMDPVPTRPSTAVPPEPDPESSDDSQANEQPTTAKVVWRQHTSAKGGFTISMPGDVKTSQEEPKIQAGSFAMTHESCGLGNGSVFDVSYAGMLYDNPETERNNTLDRLVESMVALVNGEMRSQLEFDVGDLTGREIVVDGFYGKEPVAIHARVFVAKKIAYQIVWAKVNGKAPNGESETFIRSFRLLE